MERSLTVLLPVHNAEATLAATATRILEVVCELTDRFELVIIDDGSADGTSEIGDELSRSYPQVRLLRHGESIGREAAIRIGLQQSDGQIVLVYGEAGGVAVDGIARLWRTAAAGSPIGPPTVLPGPHGRHPPAEESAAERRGFRIIDRRANQRPPRASGPTRPNYLSRLRDFVAEE